MIELPEAAVLARQSNEFIRGKRITDVVVSHTPHKLAWYSGAPGMYRELLTGQTVSDAESYGGLVEIAAGDARMLFGDGVALRYCRRGEPRPQRHQLLLEFEEGSCLVASVQMYGGLWAYVADTNDNKYYLIAKAKASPLTDNFDRAYFDSLLGAAAPNLSLKAFLATEQRIPGLGNGVLQDILFNAGMHPKRKLVSLSLADIGVLYGSVRNTLAEMVAGGGRDTESDLRGVPGGYRTRLSRNTVGKPCHVCGAAIHREAYMGGSIYYCAGCQAL